MPISYQIDSELQLIRTQCVGYITFDEVMDHFQELTQRPDLPAKLSVLLDLTQIETFPEVEQLNEIAQRMAGTAPALEWGYFAIAVEDDLMFGMSRMLEAYSGSVVEGFLVSRNLMDAEGWITAQLSAQAP